MSPDLWYGASERLSVGLVHSSLGSSGLVGGVGNALCLTGSSNGCAHVYPGAGLDARYELTTGSTAIAVDGGLYARDVDPFQLAVKLGAAARWHSGTFAIEADPNLFIGVTNRVVMNGTGNGEVLTIPVTGIYEAASRVAISAQMGLVLPFDDPGKAFMIPLSLGAQYRVDDHLAIDAAFTLGAVAGGSSVATGADLRSLTIGGGYAF